MQYQRTGVFITTDASGIFLCHAPALTDTSKYVIYNDLSEFAQSQHHRKIACLEIPYPFQQDFRSLINSICDVSDQVLIISAEIDDYIVEFIQDYDLQNIAYFLCGYINKPSHQSTMQVFPDWFSTTVEFYKNIKPDLLKVLRPYDTKEYNFDVLLGRKKTHRDHTYQFLQNNKLIDSNIVTYFDSDFDFLDGPSKWVWEDTNMSGHENVSLTVDRVTYYGFPMSLSQVIPLSVYNQTAYSVIAETCYQNHFTFFTEKTVKPILGQRMFIAISGAGYLRNLRNLGFKTFNGIIDESYDHHEQHQKRWNIALNQVKWVCEQNQDEVLAQIKPITTHNFDLLMDTDWYNWFRRNFERYL